MTHAPAPGTVPPHDEAMDGAPPDAGGRARPGLSVARRAFLAGGVAAVCGRAGLAVGGRAAIGLGLASGPALAGGGGAEPPNGPPRIAHARPVGLDMRAAAERLNALRAAAGRRAVAHDPRLSRVALAHALDMARHGFFDHRSPRGGSLRSRIRKAGYRARFAAENIALGQRDLARVLAAWMASPGHRRNILDQRARAFGMGRSEGDYWVLVLAAPL